MINTKTLVLVSIVAAFGPSLASAQVGPRIPGYLTDTSGKVVKNSYGECWHAGFWTPANAIAECDPNFIKKAEVVEPRRVVAAPEPAPIAPPPPPPPPPKPLPQRVTFSADALFDFDKATLKPQGKIELDGLATSLSDVRYDAIHVRGHTDRFGSTQYNQRLSEQRANAVRNYLVSKDIPANIIVVEGKGETQPVTKPGDCKGPKSRKIIACLQPDRRVDVEVSGSK